MGFQMRLDAMVQIHVYEIFQLVMKRRLKWGSNTWWRFMFHDFKMDERHMKYKSTQKKRMHVHDVVDTY